MLLVSNVVGDPHQAYISPISTLYLPYISPISPLYLPHISAMWRTASRAVRTTPTR